MEDKNEIDSKICDGTEKIAVNQNSDNDIEDPICRIYWQVEYLVILFRFNF